MREEKDIAAAAERREKVIAKAAAKAAEKEQKAAAKAAEKNKVKDKEDGDGNVEDDDSGVEEEEEDVKYTDEYLAQDMDKLVGGRKANETERGFESPVMVPSTYALLQVLMTSDVLGTPL